MPWDPSALDPAGGLGHQPGKWLVAKAVAIPFDAIQAESALVSLPISLQPSCIRLGSSTPSAFYLATICLFLSLCVSCFFPGGWGCHSLWLYRQQGCGNQERHLECQEPPGS